MTARFFRRALSWEALTAATGLVPPRLPGAAVEPPEGEFNIAPSQAAPILKLSQPGMYEGDYAPYGCVMMLPAFWGLVPPWWSKPVAEKTFSTFNARAETLMESRTFSGALRHGRCLVPASGFYAWSQPGTNASTPFAVALADRDWFCFAGLWSRVMIDGSELDTFTIITVEPNGLMSAFGASMPAILKREDHSQWLASDAHAPHRLLRPYPEAGMRAWPAHPTVGDVRNQGPHLMGEPPEA